MSYVPILQTGKSAVYLRTTV